jgi:aminopeptidase N
VRARSFAAAGLRALDDPTTLPAIDRAITSELSSGVVRGLRMAAHAIRSGKRGEGEVRKVRRDVEDLRDDQRKLRDRLTTLEARLGNGQANGATNGHATEAQETDKATR